MKFSVKELRARHNWTQKQAAEKVGTTYQTWNGWEQNFGNVKLKNAVKVAEAFGVTLDEIKIF